MAGGKLTCSGGQVGALTPTAVLPEWEGAELETA